jgi:hypothetical protein
MPRNADPGVVIPGIDTPEGNRLPVASLTPASQITTSHSAPYYYDPVNNRVLVTQNGAVLSGINFGSATVDIDANNVTIENCTFQAGASEWYCVQQYASASGAVVQNNTFTGGSAANPLQLTAFIGSPNEISVLNNSFVNAPGDAVDLQNGVVSGNYFSGAGYSSTGAHPDAIWVGATTGPVAITDNFIDATWAPGATSVANGVTNSAVRITTEQGNTSNVTVTGNYLLGGTFTLSAGAVGSGTFSNINVTHNYIGFGQYGALYPGAGPATNESGNVVFDFTNPAYSTQAWSAYQAGGLESADSVSSTGGAFIDTSFSLPIVNLVSSSGGNISAPTSGVATTLYGAGYRVHLTGGVGETNFVGGAGTQYLIGGPGANIFTYLSPSDSTAGVHDDISNFDSNKDVIDLSHIDANLAVAGAQNFTFIGTAAFSGAGAQVRYQQDPTDNVTYVEADLAGDSGNVSPDLEIMLGGLQTLTAANFALTAAQSTADLANGAALHVSESRVAGGGAVYSYSNVKGEPYTTFQSFYSNGVTDLADDLNLSASADTLDLYGENLTIAKGSGTESLQAGVNTFSPAYHASQTVNASAAGAETFDLSSGFGQETIAGFTASGSTADTVQFAKTAFSYLNAGMSQAQDLAAVVANATSSAGMITIRDTAGDTLALPGLTAASITSNASHFTFA